MQVFNGSKKAKEILSIVQGEVSKLSFQPLFCDILVGEDPVARSYVNIKAKRAEEIGLKFELVQLPTTVSTKDVIAKIIEIQSNSNLSGLIVQLPLPSHLDQKAILNAIDPRVDVDCLGEECSKQFYSGRSQFIPPTAGAVIEVLNEVDFDPVKTNILVIGQGDLVGRPVTFLLKRKQYKVDVADDSTDNLSNLIKVADVIISGTGHAKLIHGDMIKSGVALIDCGTSESAGSIVGDIDTESVKGKASFIAPVPGGVGPVTVARLLYNVVEVAKTLK